MKATLHISELDDDADLPLPPPDTLLPLPLTAHPFSRFTPGMTIKARVLRIEEQTRVAGKNLPLSKGAIKAKGKAPKVELTTRRSVVEAKDESTAISRLGARPTWTNLSLRKGSKVVGWVHAVTEEGLWVHLSAEIRARVFLLDCHPDVAVLSALPQHFAPVRLPCALRVPLLMSA